MKFYELKKGQAFRFANMQHEPTALVLSAGMDGAYGRYVSSYANWHDPEEWLYCGPLDEVVPESPLDALSRQAQDLGLGY